MMQNIMLIAAIAKYKSCKKSPFDASFCRR